MMCVFIVDIDQRHLHVTVDIDHSAKRKKEKKRKNNGRAFYVCAILVDHFLFSAHLWVFFPVNSSRFFIESEILYIYVCVWARVRSACLYICVCMWRIFT